MEGQMEQNRKIVNVELCEDQNCKCIGGYTDLNTSCVSQGSCKWACKLCNKVTNEDPTRGNSISIRTIEEHFTVCKNDNRELNLNNVSLMLRSVILLIVSLFLLVTLVKLVVVVIRNNNDDNVDTMDEIMLISVPREENQIILVFRKLLKENNGVK
jgi:hypothetical protein